MTVSKKLTFLFIASVFFLQGCGALTGLNDKRPNFLIILTDDQRYDSMQYMPQTQSVIFDQGATFSHGFITTPLCCPSRSSILTGMYAHNHGVTDNTYELHKETFFELMHTNGYYTGLVGKYLNSWNGDPRPEFDSWVSYKFGETRYYNPLLNVNGKWERHQGEYVTYTLGNYAMDFLGKAANQSKPFVLLLAVNAPHDPVTPAIEDKDMKLELPPRLPSFNEVDVSDKPAWVGIKNGAGMDEASIKTLDEFRRDQILTLIALDRTLGKVLAKLKETGEMDNTMIIFLSDNGTHWGEHRMTDKNTLYEESIRVPFAIRYPPLIAKPYVENKVVANIDIAPTLLDLAQIPIPKDMNGLSMVNLLKHQGDWREGVLIEGWPPRGAYTAIHTEQYIYGETVGDDTAPTTDPQLELYDLKSDPFEMENIAYNPKYQDLVTHLKSLLTKEKSR